jgi:hypothetical protein
VLIVATVLGATLLVFVSHRIIRSYRWSREPRRPGYITPLWGMIHRAYDESVRRARLR